jgi:hypothetical protein
MFAEECGNTGVRLPSPPTNMKTHTYWNNSKQWHGEKMAEIKAESIEEADKVFLKAHGLSKIPGHISTTINKEEK